MKKKIHGPIVFCLLFLLGNFFLSACSRKGELTRLKVFAHEPFVSSVSHEFNERIREFEEDNEMRVEWVSYGDSALPVLARMQKDPDFEIDLLYGLDNTNLLEFKQSQLFLCYKSQELGKLVEELKLDKDYLFTPVNYGWLAFEYSIKSWQKKLPESLEDLSREAFKNNYILINPRVSGVGFLFALWLDACQYDVSQIFPLLVKNAFNVAPDWSTAYTMYSLGEAPFVLTYSSSPAYHEIVESDPSYKTVLDKNSSYLQVEFMGIPKRSKKKELAKKFLDYMLSEKVQRTLPEKVWVFPARKNVVLPAAFERIKKPQKLLYHTPEEIQKLRETWYQCDWF